MKDVAIDLGLGHQAPRHPGDLGERAHRGAAVRRTVVVVGAVRPKRGSTFQVRGRSGARWPSRRARERWLVARSRHAPRAGHADPAPDHDRERPAPRAPPRREHNRPRARDHHGAAGPAGSAKSPVAHPARPCPPQLLRSSKPTVGPASVDELRRRAGRPVDADGDDRRLVGIAVLEAVDAHRIRPDSDELRADGLRIDAANGPRRHRGARAQIRRRRAATTAPRAQDLVAAHHGSVGGLGPR